MTITYLDAAPRKVRFFEVAPPGAAADEMAEGQMTAAQVNHLGEIFNTPLTGTYNWDYRVADDRINKLYELGKQLNWNASLDVHWDRTPDWHAAPPLSEARRREIIESSPWTGYGAWDSMADDRKLEFARHDQAWSLSQFLHGEQGALLVASQLVSCAPSFNAKMYAASQTFDEARHVEVFNRYLQRKMGLSYP